MAKRVIKRSVSKPQRRGKGSSAKVKKKETGTGPRKSKGSVESDNKVSTSKTARKSSSRSRKQMKIAFVASEAVPLVKVGGLADVVGALPKALSELGLSSVVILPAYSVIDREAFNLRDTGIKISSPIGSHWLEASVEETEIGPVKYYLVRYDPFFAREGIYGTSSGDYPDNLERYAFFSKVALELLKRLDYRPDVIHCNDWQTGLLPLFKQAFYSEDPFYSSTKVVFAIHNIAYQGLFPVEKFYLLGLDWSYFTYQGIEFYGKGNCLKAGIVYADKVVTVSPRYAKEIQTPEYGWGLDGVLRTHKAKLEGIINGIDYDYWNPWIDPYLPDKFGVRANRCFLKGKAVNKVRLLEELGLKAVDVLAVFVGRLVEQKGIDVLVSAFQELLPREKVGLVILGRGEARFEAMVSDLAGRFPDKVRSFVEFNEPLAHRLYGGADVVVVPSRYEPCGLTQMIGMRYGALPVARRTGGLVDTIPEDVGFLFDKATGADLLSSLESALEVFRDADGWRERVKRAMKLDFSWSRSAREYKRMYERLLKQGK